MQPPDRRRDDAFFADLFPKTGDRTSLAQLMNTTNSSVTQQLAQENEDKSYYHAGKLSLYAADTMDKIDGGTRGEVLWNDLAASRAAWLGSPRPVRVKFPARLAHEVVAVRETVEQVRHAVRVAERRERPGEIASGLEARLHAVERRAQLRQRALVSHRRQRSRRGSRN